MTEDEETADQALVMPFLPVTSKGGPHDDDAYTAGYEMGMLDVRLEQAAILTRAEHDAGMRAPRELRVSALTIRDDNRGQADLLCMRHGFTAVFQPTGVEGWTAMYASPAAAGETP